MSKPLVVLSGIFYPMAILRYFEAALKRRTDIELVTVGVYTGRKIPWGGGMVLPQRYARPPDRVLPDTCRRGVPLVMAYERLGRQADLWIQVDAGMWLEGRVPGLMSVVVGTDPHVLDYSRQRKAAHKFFCMQAVYADPSDIYLPYAYDPIWHAPEVLPKQYDAGLIGLQYRQRQDLIRKLRSKGLAVLFELGPVFEEARTLYGQTRIGLNWSSKDDLVARVFEITAMGLPLVTNKVTDLDKFFPPGSLLRFSTEQEAVKNVLELWRDENLRKVVAEAGMEAVKPHTYDARVDQILQETIYASS